MTEKLGIDLLEDFAEDVVAVIKKVIDAKADDNEISKAEIIGMIPKAYEVGKDLLNAKELFAQAKDIDTEEGKRLLTKIISLGILGDKAQIIAINVVELAEGAVVLYNKNVAPIVEMIKK